MDPSHDFKHTLTHSKSASSSLKNALDAKKSSSSNLPISSNKPPHVESEVNSPPKDKIPPKQPVLVKPFDFSLGDDSEEEEELE